MKYAITSTGKDRNSSLDSRFGRARVFVIYDAEKKEIIDTIDNASISAGHGAGIRTSQVLIDGGVSAILTGAVGPNAFEVLTQAALKMYSNQGQKTVNDAIELINSGKLEPIMSAGRAHQGLK